MTAEEQAGDWLGREPLLAPRIIDPAGAAPKGVASGMPPPDDGEETGALQKGFGWPMCSVC